MNARVMNDEIWVRNEKTDPAFTKPITGKRFRGTSTNATYIVKRLTAEFGPAGFGWGVNVLKSEMLQGAALFAISEDNKRIELGHEIIHSLMIEFWYRAPDGSRASFNQFGQTPFVSKESKGIFTDDEAPKKSLTDALLKAASWLGFAADIHLGFFDDNKYVNDRRLEEAGDAKQTRIDRALSVIDRASKPPLKGQPAHPELNGDGIPALDENGFEIPVRVKTVMDALSKASDSDALTKVERRTRPLMLELEHAQSPWLEKLIAHMASVRERLPAAPAWTLEDMPEP